MNEPFPDNEPLFPEADIVFAKFWIRFGAMLIRWIGYRNHHSSGNLFQCDSVENSVDLYSDFPLTIIYKPFMEYQYGATLGKMAVGIKVVGHQFQKVTLKEELRRVSFYIVPNIIQQVLTLKFYFSNQLNSIQHYKDYNDYIVSTNPALYILNIIVIVLLVVDTITFFSNDQNRSLHDLYAGTYVIEKRFQY